MREGFVFVFLLLCALHDGRKKTIPVWLLFLGLFGGVLYRLLVYLALGQWNAADVLSGASLGLLLIGLGKLVPGSVGEGDGWLFFDTGIWLGLEENLSLLWLSFLGAMAAAGVLWLCKKAGRKTCLPLAPFVLGAYVCLGFLKGAGA